MNEGGRRMGGDERGKRGSIYRERERERERERKTLGRKLMKLIKIYVCVEERSGSRRENDSVCVCVCV